MILKQYLNAVLNTKESVVLMSPPVPFSFSPAALASAPAATRLSTLCLPHERECRTLFKVCNHVNERRGRDVFEQFGGRGNICVWRNMTHHIILSDPPAHSTLHYSTLLCSLTSSGSCSDSSREVKVLAPVLLAAVLPDCVYDTWVGVVRWIRRDVIVLKDTETVMLLAMTRCYAMQCRKV